MNTHNPDSGKYRLNILLFFSLLLIFFSYSNSLNSSWHFDDTSNILNNKKVHLEKINYDSIIDTFTASTNSTDKLYRPLPMFTFALNWYFSQDKVYSYHIVNILIHILTAYALFSVIRLLLFSCYAKRYSPSFINTIALLATLLWALAPIQTQAVTYIIQRMAAMAAMFTIFAIYTYLRARAEKTRKKYCWFLLCLIFYLAALGSKSNAILLPASLLFLEISFFNTIKTKKTAFYIFALSGIILLAAFLFAYYGLGLRPLNLEAYNHRPFTLTERLLTEPRIVIMYLSQLTLPIADRLSLEHDIVLSTSLLSPWTTLPSLFFIFFVIAVSLRYLKKYPIFSFPILFFFLNHLVESTFIPLELVFEHRNYLPSLFFFLPIGYLFAQALYGKKRFSSVGRIAVMLCGAFYLTISSQATYTRNQAWATEGSLYQDALKKAPVSSRAALQLGIWNSRNGHYNKAYYYFRHAFKYAKNSPAPNYMKCLALNSLALNRIALSEYKQAEKYIQMCFAIEKNIDCQKRKVDIYLRQELYQDALSVAKALADTYPADQYQIKAALAAYHANKLNTALEYLQKIAYSSVMNDKILYLTGLVLMKKGAYPNSLFFLKRAIRLSPHVIKYNFALAAAYYKNKQVAQAEKVIQKLFNEHALAAITNVLMRIKKLDLNQEDISFIENNLTSLIMSSKLLNKK